MVRIILILVLLPSLAFAIDPPTNVGSGDPVWTLDGTFPERVYDRAIEGWMIQAYLGNFGVRGAWYDGPRLEVGGDQPSECVTNPTDDMSYCPVGDVGQDLKKLVKVDNSTGVVRLLLGSTGLYEGDTEEAVFGYPFYNSYDDSIYLIGHGYCIRKIVEGTPDTVEVVAGDCETSGTTNETGTNARFQYINGAAADGLGNIYIITGSTLRKMDVNGEVTTITPTRTCGANWEILNYSKAAISLGADPTEFWIADSNGTSACGYWGILKYDTETGVLTRAISLPSNDDPYTRHTGTEKDGPATTFAYLKNGAHGVYVPFYESYFPYGQDNIYLQRYDPDDDWVYTYGEYRRSGIAAVGHTLAETVSGDSLPMEQRPVKGMVSSTSLLASARGYDSYGGLWIRYSGSNTANGILWRAYNTILGGVAR